MQPDYLARLPPQVQAFVHEVEADAGIDIEVAEEAGLNDGGPEGEGKLRIKVHRNPVRLEAPTNGYFPPGGVVHEVLHMRRARVDGVPLLVGSDDCDPDLEQGLFHMDNALEHLAIVPEELARNPERLDHWLAVMRSKWSVDLPKLAGHPAQRIWELVHWVFVREVLAGTDAIDTARALLAATGLQAEADAFADQLLAGLADKPKAVQLCMEHFGLPKAAARLEYLPSRGGPGRKVPIG
jgi:hypothetical protein